jgi:hypothetical protein
MGLGTLLLALALALGAARPARHLVRGRGGGGVWLLGFVIPARDISVSDNQTTPGGNRRHLPLQNPVRYRNRVVEAVKVGNPRPVHPSAPSSLRNHTAAPVRAPIPDEPSSTATPPKNRNDRANQLEDVQRWKAS